jgi:tetratricopeptide (TPR) repeat protein
MENPDEVKSLIHFQLDQLSSLNHHHEFEDICRHLVKARICSNIIPATGPVANGGDQGRDFETFRTYLMSSSIGDSSFLGLASEKPLVFACTTQKDNILGKIKADVKKIVGSGSKIEGIHYFTTINIPVAQNHSTKSWVKTNYKIPLEIYDGNAISELLADEEIMWIAQKYLSIPKGFILSKKKGVLKIPRIPGSIPPIWNIPFNRNPNFTGRTEYLDALHKTLHSGKFAALTQALTGLGGMGKTQIAIEYSYRYSSEYDLIWWIRAEEKTTLASDFLDLGNYVSFGQIIPEEVHLRNSYIQQWFNTHEKWLLIFDNAQDPSDLYNPSNHSESYLPQSSTGHVLITSRNPNWSSLAFPLNIQVFHPEEAIAFLQKRIGQSDINGIPDLAKELGYLPLALEQASAFIIETPSMTAQLYISIFRKKHLQLWDKEKSPTNYPDTVATTWNISIERILQENPDVLGLLFICVFYAAEDIPIFLVKQPVKDDITFGEITKYLKKYSLIEIASEKISIHRLLQLVIRDSLDADDKKLWLSRAIILLNNIFDFNPDDPNTWAKSTMLLPHVLSVVTYAEQEKIEPELTERLLGNAGNYFLKFAEYEKAKEINEVILKNAERIHGSTHKEVAAALNNLGISYKYLGKFSKAESYLRRALKVNEDLFGLENMHVASAANNLGSILRDLGDYSAAKEQYERSIAIIQKKRKTRSTEASKSINNLGQIYHDLGDYKRAKILYTRALKIDEWLYGSTHPEVARDINNIGLLLQDMGEPTQAKIEFERSLKIYEDLFGPHHPEVAVSLNNYGRILQEIGDLPGAIKHFKRALDIYENLFGPNYHEIARIANNLGVALIEMDDLTEAKIQIERALEIDEKCYGIEHDEVATDLNNLGSIYTILGQWTDAKKQYDRALLIEKKSFGEIHPHIARTIQNIGELYLQKGDFLIAKKYLEESIAIFTIINSSDNIDIGKAATSLGEVLLYLGEFSNAKKQFEMAKKIFDKKLDPDALFAITVRNRLNFIFRSQIHF